MTGTGVGNGATSYLAEEHEVIKKKAKGKRQKAAVERKKMLCVLL